MKDVVIGHLLMGAKIRFYFETRKEIGEKFQKKVIGRVFGGHRKAPHALQPVLFLRKMEGMHKVLCLIYTLGKILTTALSSSPICDL